MLVEPSPVIALNRAVAVAMAESPQRGLAEIDRIEGLDYYLHLHSARGDLLERAGRAAEAGRPSAARSGCDQPGGALVPRAATRRAPVERPRGRS